MIVSYSMEVNRPRGGLPSAAVIGPLDPGHDRDPEILAGGPGPPIESILLQREEALHGGIVTGGVDPPHRADQAVASESTHALPGPKLGKFNRSVCRIQPATSVRLATALVSAATASRDFIRESMD